MIVDNEQVYTSIHNRVAMSHNPTEFKQMMDTMVAYYSYTDEQLLIVSRARRYGWNRLKKLEEPMTVKEWCES